MNKTQFATAVLQGLGIKPSAGALQAMVGWMNAEGGHWHNDANYNPLNTTQVMPGAGNTGSQGNIKVYKNWQQGVDATVKTLRYGAYKGILSGFKAGNPGAVASAIDHSPWGTHGALVYQAIGGAPKGLSAATDPGASPNATGGAQRPTTRSVTSQTIPGVDNSAQRQQVLAAYLANTHNPDALVALAAGLLGSKDTPAQTVTTTSATAAAPGKSKPLKVAGSKALSTTFGGVTENIKAGAIPNVSKARDVPGLDGVVAFDGKPVAAWVGYVLDYARRHGWQGSLSEGFRTDAQQTGIYNSGVRPAAKPKSLGGGGSNHEIKTFPGGAADVSQAAQLAAILAKSPYRSLLQWAGSKDPVHFSHPHNGSY